MSDHMEYLSDRELQFDKELMYLGLQKYRFTDQHLSNLLSRIAKHYADAVTVREFEVIANAKFKEGAKG